MMPDTLPDVRSYDEIEAEVKAFEEAERRRLQLDEDPIDHWVDCNPQTFTRADRDATTILFGGLTLAHDQIVSAAIAGTLAVASRAEMRRSSTSPPPEWATIQASTKWRGAPPRWPRTVWRRRPSDSRPTNSASVSSSCGGHAVSWTRRKARTPAVHAPTPMTNARSRTRSRRRKVGLATARSPSTGQVSP